MIVWRFNLSCLFVGFMFFLGIVWLWRPSFVRTGYVFEEKFLSGVLLSQPRPGEAIKTSSTLDKLENEIADDSSREVVLNTGVDKADEIVEPDKAEALGYKQEFSVNNELQGVIKHVLVNLDVPFTSQAPEKNWEQPWQDACEEAAILMLEAYYKGYGLSPLFAKDEILKIIDWEEEQNWGSSIPIKDIGVLFETYITINKKPKLVENLSVLDIKTFLDKGLPILAVADGTELPNKWYSGDGPDYHALIIRGYTSDGKFITNDPGVNRGRNFSFPADDLMEALHDWNGGNVAEGRKAVLVLE